jgi:MoxR-like ATPase
MPTHGHVTVPSSRSVFIGREREVRAVNEAFEQARSGRPGVVLIEGEAGIGKTALIERFLADLRDVAVLSSSVARTTTQRTSPWTRMQTTSRSARGCSSCSEDFRTRPSS